MPALRPESVFLFAPPFLTLWRPYKVFLVSAGRAVQIFLSTVFLIGAGSLYDDEIIDRCEVAMDNRIDAKDIKVGPVELGEGRKSRRHAGLGEASACESGCGEPQKHRPESQDALQPRGLHAGAYRGVRY